MSAGARVALALAAVLAARGAWRKVLAWDEMLARELPDEPASDAWKWARR